MGEEHLARDRLSQVGELTCQSDQQVVHRQHPDEAAVTDDCETTQAVRAEEGKGVVDIRVGSDRDHRRGHHAVDANVIGNSSGEHSTNEIPIGDDADQAVMIDDRE